MTEPIDEAYLTWLYARIGSERATNPERSYWCLLRQLYTKEFVWLVPNDDNRVEDGRYLRIEFLHEGKFRKVDDEWMQLGCSMLELLIGVCERLAFETDEDLRKWFWVLLDNLGIGHYNDTYYRRYRKSEQIIDDILDTVIWRTYAPDGSGGLFPLNDPDQDQRDVEIWYQLCAYILERI